MIKKLLLAVLCAPLALAGSPAFASEAEVRLEHAPIDVRDVASLQSGARTFVNYCLNCHSASLVRYNQLTGIGLTDDQIRDSLMFTAEKVGEPMNVAISRKEGKEWFGVAPPDLSVVARSRGADWLYTYLRGFYRDPASPSGWNNIVFPNVGMPHVLWQLQGERSLVHAEHGAETHGPVAPPAFQQVSAGTLNSAEYDTVARDLTNFLVWMGEPHQLRRKQIGYIVLGALTALAFITWLLYKEYWKDVH
ncbi:MAG: cytochrome c1 [Burkholderiales bacterium]